MGQLREDITETSAEVASIQDMSAELWGFANDANDRVQELQELLHSADIVMQSGAKQQGNLEDQVEFLKARIKVYEGELQEQESRPTKPSADEALRIKLDLQEKLAPVFDSE